MVAQTKELMTTASVDTIPALQAGLICRCIRRRHSGWRVRILKVSDTAVEFEQVAGPAQSRGRRDRWTRTAFLNCYSPI